MALLKDLLKDVAHGAGIAAGAGITRAASVSLGGASGYLIGGQVPFSPVVALGAYALSGLMGRGMLAGALSALGTGALASWGSGIGEAVAQQGLSANAIFGIGAALSAAQYAQKFDLADRRARAAAK